MARIDKYYGTNLMASGRIVKNLRELGYSGSHSQFSIVCKAKSRAEANRIAEGYGLGKIVFSPDYTSETGNEKQIELCDKYGFIISLDGTLGIRYVALEEVL